MLTTTSHVFNQNDKAKAYDYGPNLLPKNWLSNGARSSTKKILKLRVNNRFWKGKKNSKMVLKAFFLGENYFGKITNIWGSQSSFWN